MIELQYDRSGGALYALHWSIPQMVGSHDAGRTEPAFRVFPNPVSRSQPVRVFLDDDFVGKVKIEIVSPGGQILHVLEQDKTSRQQVFELRHPSTNGEFVVRVSGGRGRTARIVLNRQIEK